MDFGWAFFGFLALVIIVGGLVSIFNDNPTQAELENEKARIELESKQIELQLKQTELELERLDINTETQSK